MTYLEFLRASARIEFQWTLATHRALGRLSRLAYTRIAAGECALNSVEESECERCWDTYILVKTSRSEVFKCSKRIKGKRISDFRNDISFLFSKIMLLLRATFVHSFFAILAWKYMNCRFIFSYRRMKYLGVKIVFHSRNLQVSDKFSDTRIINFGQMANIAAFSAAALACEFEQEQFNQFKINFHFFNIIIF